MLGETFSHYRIIEPLGEGGMGSVYVAEDTSLGRRVAIKFLSSTAHEYRARFIREARAVSSLTHPNIAAVFDYGETPDGKPFLVMELIDGEPLSDKLVAGSLPLPEAVRVISEIASALGEAHEHGVVHRDVKPSNVVINRRGQVKVVDFGLVKQIGEGVDAEVSTANAHTRTRSDVIVGTPLYLSPEQATGKKVDGRSDLFALGAVLYECIAGQSAFGGGSVLEIGAQVIHVDPPLPSTINPAVPPELDRITKKAIAKSPDARYQTAAELIEDLRNVAPTLDAVSTRVGRQTTQVARPRTHSASALTTLTDTLRRPRLSLGTVLVAVAIVAILGWLIYQWRKPSQYRPNSTAAEWYARGIEALRNGAFVQATKAFQQVVANDPNYPLGHARLSEAWFELDYSDRAKDEMLKAQKLIEDRSRLARTDTLRIDAIGATVTRDFPAAITAYSELSKLSPKDPQVCADLGRAYERYDDVKSAVSSFVEATNHASQYAPAFLHLGVLYGIQANLPGANSNFEKAQTLFQASGNYEGEGEVAYQWGALFDNINNEKEAKPHLDRALQIARTTGNQYLEVKTLLKLGTIAAGADQNYDLSRQLINQALDLAKSNGIDNQRKRGLVDLGNSYLIQADFETALNFYRQSLELSEQQSDNRNAARAMLSLASALLRLSRPDEAAGYIEKALSFYEQAGYRKERAQALNLLARASEQKGQIKPALDSYERLLKLTEDIGDQFLIMPVQNDLGRTLVIAGRFPEAVPHFEQNLAIAKSLQQEKDVSLALSQLANVSWQMGRYDAARNFLAEETYIVEKPKPAANAVGYFHLVNARLAWSQKNLDDAKALAQKTVEFAGAKFKNYVIEGSYILGLAQVFAGDAAGIKMCQEAAAQPELVGNPSLKSEALLALAEALSYQNKESEALKIATEANELLVHLGKPQHEWIAAVIMAKASRATGDSASAQQHATRASSILSELEKRWGTDNYNSYLHRGDVRFYREQLDELLSLDVKH